MTNIHNNKTTSIPIQKYIIKFISIKKSQLKKNNKDIEPICVIGVIGITELTPFIDPKHRQALHVQFSTKPA